MISPDSGQEMAVINYVALLRSSDRPFATLISRERGAEASNKTKS